MGREVPLPAPQARRTVLVPILAAAIVALFLGAGSLALLGAPLHAGESGLPPRSPVAVSISPAARPSHPSTPAAQINGVDVSHYQGTVTWSSVYGAGYVFSFAKAAEGESSGCDDSTFATNMVNGKAAGEYMAAYDFAELPTGSVQACSSADNATTEANQFLSVAGPYFKDGYMYPALDQEQGCPSDGSGSLTAQQLSHWDGMWLSTVSNYISTNDGYNILPIIYTDSSEAGGCIEPWLTAYPLWIANYGVSSPATGAWSSWAFWQYSSSGSVSGISGSSDVDHFNGAVTTLNTTYVFGGGGTPPPPTVSYAMQDLTTSTALTCGSSFAAGDSIQFTATVTGGTSPYTYAWAFGDGGTGTTNPVTHVYTTAGTVNPLITVTDKNGKTGSSGTGCSFTVTGSAPLTVSASATPPTSGPAPLTVAFTCTPSGGTGGNTFAWTFGDGGTSTSQNPSYIYKTAGSYTATCKVTDSGAISATSSGISITVTAPPLTITATSNRTSATVGMPITFGSTASGGSGTYSTYAWRFGDGTTAATANPTHSYAFAGTFHAIVNVTDSASNSATSNTLAITVTAVASNPSVVIASNRSSSTVGMPVSFTSTVSGGTSGYTYAWAFGDTTTSTSANPTHAYSAAGTDTVSLVVTDSLGRTGTSNSLSITVTSVGGGPLPLTASLTSSAASGAVGTSVTFTTAVGGGTSPFSYAWSGLPTGCTSSSTATLTCTPSAAGNFLVQVVVTDSGSPVQTVTKTIDYTVTASVSPLSVSLAASATSGTVGTAAWFNASVAGGSTPYSFAWSGLPTGCVTVDASSLPCTPTAAGTNLIQVTVSDSSSPTQTLTRLLHFNVSAVAGKPGGSTSGAPTYFGLSQLQFEVALLLVGVAVAAAVAAVALSRRRGRSPPEGEEGVAWEAVPAPGTGVDGWAPAPVPGPDVPPGAPFLPEGPA